GEQCAIGLTARHGQLDRRARQLHRARRLVGLAGQDDGDAGVGQGYAAPVQRWAAAHEQPQQEWQGGSPGWSPVHWVDYRQSARPGGPTLRQITRTAELSPAGVLPKDRWQWGFAPDASAGTPAPAQCEPGGAPASRVPAVSAWMDRRKQ